MSGSQAHIRSRRLRPRGVLVLAIALLLLSGLVSPAALADDWAPPRTVFVDAAGHTVDGLFLELWRTHPELVGLPLTEEYAAKAGYLAPPEASEVVQYYENVALVYLPTEPTGAQVQTLDLGRDALSLALEERPSQALMQATRRTACGSGAPADCRGVAASGHTLRGMFRAFWEEHGGEQLLGLPLTEALRTPDGAWIQYFEGTVLQQRATGVVQPLPLGRVAATRLQLDTDPIEQPEAVPRFEEGLFVAPPEPEPAPSFAVSGSGPGPQQGAYKEIVVSISAQALWAYENGELLRSALVSTGTAEVPGTVTPIGSFQILTKYDIQDMEGTISDEYYFVPDVPDVMYFDNLGNALHGTYWHNNFGTPMSHGCINLPLDVAAWMYDWAPVGTAVTVVP